MKYLQAFLQQGHKLLLWANQLTPTDQTAIGGGISRLFSPQQLPIYAAQNRFIQNFCKLLSQSKYLEDAQMAQIYQQYLQEGYQKQQQRPTEMDIDDADISSYSDPFTSPQQPVSPTAELFQHFRPVDEAHFTTKSMSLDDQERPDQAPALPACIAGTWSSTT